jgi:RNA polymerase sigma-70 factor (ECF subfamily)
MKTKLSSYSEHELVTLLKSGSEPAFKELFVRFEQKLYHYTLKFTRSKEATEEILQDIFIKLWEYRENLDTTLSFNALMFRIAKNNILNYLRNESRQMSMRKEYSFSMEAMRNSTEEKIFFEEYIRMTDRAIDNLPAQRRSIFKMSRYEGKSYEEIAGVLGISKDTVRLQIIKSLKSLKKSMVTYVDMPVG